MLQQIHSAEQTLIATLKQATAALDAVGSAEVEAALADLRRAAQEAKARLENAAAGARDVFYGLVGDASTVGLHLSADLFGPAPGGIVAAMEELSRAGAAEVYAGVDAEAYVREMRGEGPAEQDAARAPQQPAEPQRPEAPQPAPEPPANHVAAEAALRLDAFADALERGDHVPGLPDAPARVASEVAAIDDGDMTEEVTTRPLPEHLAEVAEALARRGGAVPPLGEVEAEVAATVAAQSNGKAKKARKRR